MAVLVRHTVRQCRRTRRHGEDCCVAALLAV